MPATRRAHSPNDGPLAAALRLGTTRRFRDAALVREGEIVGMMVRFSQSPLASSAAKERYLSFLAAYRLEQGTWRFFAWQSCKLGAAPALKA